MIAISMDVEWATPQVIRDSLDLLSEYSVPATLFSTHDDGFDADPHERALHPNFLDDDTPEAVLSDLSAFYPDAVGTRSHAMYTYSGLRSLYEEHGLMYESNYMMYGVNGIQPFEMTRDVVQLPVYFMDDTWLRRSRGSDAIPDPESLISGPGLKVFDFHPPHVAFNTPSISYYEENKDAYWDEVTDLRDLRSADPGVRDLFVRLLEHVDDHDVETRLLGDIARDVRNRATDTAPDQSV